MVRRSTILLILLFICPLATGSVLRAHEGHPHKIMGTVTMASADHLMLKDRTRKGHHRQGREGHEGEGKASLEG